MVARGEFARVRRGTIPPARRRVDPRPFDEKSWAEWECANPSARICDENVVEAAGVEISRDVNETERLLHEQELGVLADPTSSVAIRWSRAERGQSVRARDPTAAARCSTLPLRRLVERGTLGR
jgi:hypothetical protein